MKKWNALLLVVALVAVMLQPVAAEPVVEQVQPVVWSTEDTEGIVPYWSELATLTNGLTISGTTARIGASATAYNTTHKVQMTATLQKASGSSYGTVTSWSNTATWTCGISKTQTVTSGTYRVKLVIKIYNSSGTLLETVTDYSNTATC